MRWQIWIVSLGGAKQMRGIRWLDSVGKKMCLPKEGGRFGFS